MVDLVGAGGEVGGVGDDDLRRRRVGATVQQEPHLGVDQGSVPAGTQLDPDTGGVPVDMADERLLAVVGHLDGTAQTQRQHAGMDMHRQILPTSERPADSAQGQAHPARIQPESGCHLAPVVVDPLRRHVQVDTAAPIRYRETGFRTQEGRILDPGGVLPSHHHLRP